MKVEPDQAPPFLDEWSALSTLAALTGAFFAMFVVLGAGFTAIVLAVARDRMFAQFAGAFGAVADTFTVDHESDSIGCGRPGFAHATRYTSVGACVSPAGYCCDT
jgi:hypothetical protein